MPVQQIPSLQNKEQEKILNVATLVLVAYSIFLTVRGTASLQAGLLITGFILILLANRGSIPDLAAEAKWLLWPLIILSGWILVTAFFVHSVKGASQPWFSLRQWQRDLLQPMLGFFCGYIAFRSSDAKRKLFTTQAVFTSLISFLCIYQYVHGEYYHEERGDILYVGTLYVRGLAHDNNFFSYVLILLFPGALWLMLTGDPKKRFTRAGLLNVLMILLLIFLNKRRAVWIAVYLDILVLAWWYSRKSLALILLATLLMGGVAYKLRPHWFVRQYDSKGYTMKSSRLFIAEKVPELAREHPWIGVGFGKDAVVKNYWMRFFMHAHNTFVNVLLEIGFPGLLLFLFALGVYGSRLLGLDPGNISGRIGFLLLLGMCVRSMTDDIWLSSIAELFWFQLGVFMPFIRRNPV